MPSVFGKLNLKNQKQILILNAPASFEGELKALRDVEVLRDLKRAKQVEFSLAFITKRAQVDGLASALGKKVEGDAIVWLAYPKGSSKKYTSEFKRGDGSWDSFGREGFEPVRMVAIDDDWSAVRFRRIGFIKNMTRGKEHLLTERAKKK